MREELAATLLAGAGEAIRGDGELLDAGCGTGWWLRRLAAEGVPAERLHGIERSPPRAAAARAAAPRAAILEGDVTALPYEAGRFGAVFLITVLSSLPDRAAATAAIEEAWRVLAPGGVLVAWEPRVPTPNRATRLIRRRDLQAATGVTPASVSLTVAPPLARRLGAAAPRWYPRLARIPLLRTHRAHFCRRPGR
jgi:SAM-dependent methyltransferase